MDDKQYDPDEMPDTDDLQEPSVEKEPDEEPKAPADPPEEPSHRAQGIGVVPTEEPPTEQ